MFSDKCSDTYLLVFQSKNIQKPYYIFNTAKNDQVFV